MLSYAAPTLAEFSGPGAENATTVGGSVVNITGSNFGFSDVSLDSVYYRSDVSCLGVFAYTRASHAVFLPFLFLGYW